VQCSHTSAHTDTPEGKTIIAAGPPGANTKLPSASSQLYQIGWYLYNNTHLRPCLISVCRKTVHEIIVNIAPLIPFILSGLREDICKTTPNIRINGWLDMDIDKHRFDLFIWHMPMYTISLHLHFTQS